MGKIALYIGLFIAVAGILGGIYYNIKGIGRNEQKVKHQEAIIDSFEESMKDIGDANTARHSIDRAPERLRIDDGYRRD